LVNSAIVSARSLVGQRGERQLTAGTVRRRAARCGCGEEGGGLGRLDVRRAGSAHSSLQPVEVDLPGDLSAGEYYLDDLTRLNLLPSY
jgi:hypothetical protein